MLEVEPTEDSGSVRVINGAEESTAAATGADIHTSPAAAPMVTIMGLISLIVHLDEQPTSPLASWPNTSTQAAPLAASITAKREGQDTSCSRLALALVEVALELHDPLAALRVSEGKLKARSMHGRYQSGWEHGCMQA